MAGSLETEVNLVKDVPHYAVARLRCRAQTGGRRGGVSRGEQRRIQGCITSFGAALRTKRRGPPKQKSTQLTTHHNAPHHSHGKAKAKDRGPALTLAGRDPPKRQLKPQAIPCAGMTGGVAAERDSEELLRRRRWNAVRRGSSSREKRRSRLRQGDECGNIFDVDEMVPP